MRKLFPKGRRTRISATVALLVLVGVVAALIAGIGTSSPRASADSRTASGATAVERRNLVETDTESGTLGYSKPQTVYNHLSGTVTWLPRVGQTIKPGHTLFKVAGQPVILMNGSTPAYRELDSSDSAGQDVLELNRNLVELGFNPDGIVIDDTWQAATTAGVEAFQASLGESQTGKLTLGKVVFLPGDQLVSTVEGTLGASVSDPQPSSGPDFVSLETTTDTTTPTTTTTTPTTSSSTPHKSSNTKLTRLERMIAQLKAEIKALKTGNGNHPSSPSSGSSNPSSGSSNPSSGSSNPSSGSSNPGSGGGGGGATAILETTSTELIVTVDLDASKQSEAVVGEPVTVEMPAGNIVHGKITAVSSVASSSSNSDNGNSDNGSSDNNSDNGNSGTGSSGATIPVTISLSSHQSGAGLDQAAVSVNFAQAKAKNVLSVPVTALLAVSGGNYAVQEAAAPHRLIPVTTGLFAAGYVQISGSGVYSGLQVTDSQG